MHSHVLLVGEADVGKHSLASLICGRTLAKGAAPFPLKLDTKYYTADVLVNVSRVGDVAERLAHEAVPEAAVLVFAAARCSSLLSLQRWWEAAAFKEDVAIKLAAAMTCTAAASDPEAAACLRQAEAWCLDQHIELVEVCAQGGDNGQSEGDDATGARRVVEALQAHMWPGLELKDAPRSGGAPLMAHPAAGPAELDLPHEADDASSEAEIDALSSDSSSEMDAMERAFAEIAGACAA